jgi:DNA-binding GntR family transcriptional regulator
MSNPDGPSSGTDGPSSVSVDTSASGTAWQSRMAALTPPLEGTASLQRPPTLTGAVVEYIRDAVVRGQLSPGMALPEVRLAEQLSTSRGTVREALRALHDVGLVEIRPHRGAFVTDLTARRAAELFDLRALLEPHAIKTAIQGGFVDDATMIGIREAFAALGRSHEEGDMFAVIDADMNLHWVLASASRQELLLEHLNALQLQTRRAVIYTKLYDTDTETEVTSHAPILDAVEARDADRAAATLCEHILRSGSRLVERMERKNAVT